MNILIIGGGLQGLSCAESLYKKHSVSVIGCGFQTEHSRFYDKVYDPSFSTGDSLINLLIRGKFDVLIPVSDINVTYISKNKEKIEATTGVKCAVPPYSNVYPVEDKRRFMVFCHENGIPHPKTASLNNIEDASLEVGFPALIKPDYSVGARGITRVNSIEELKEKYPMVAATYGSCTLQELIDNREYYYNVMLYRDKKGNFPASTIIKIVRMYPVNAGSSSCCISIENNELLDICKDCLNKLNWVGMADFDVLQRIDNGEYKIIEINPRVPASLRAAAISGVNFPEIIVDDAMELPIQQYNYYTGKMLRYMGTDMMWFLKSPSRFRSKPSWLHFWGKDIYYMDIIKKDPSTWWTWLIEGITKLNKRYKRLR